MKFVNLHGHSTVGSPGDALNFPEEHMDFAFENGSRALALTDHGNMNGFSYQYLHGLKMKKDGKDFKPLYGVEAYFVPSISKWKDLYLKTKDAKSKGIELQISENESETKSGKKIDPLRRRAHLVLLAKNETGLKNLFKLVSKSYQGDNQYYYPRMDFRMLRAHSEGIIALSACLGGVISVYGYWMHRDQGYDVVRQKTQEIAQEFYDIFGDDFYGELQWNAIPEQHEINKLIIDVSSDIGYKLVSTADSHYARPELWKDRTLYKKMAWYGSSENTLPASIDDLGYELYPKNGNQMWESYKKYSTLCNTEYDEDIIRESLENTYDIAFSKIDDIVLDTRIKLPSFILQEGEDPDEILKQKALDGLRKRNLLGKPEYEKRLKKELDVIISRGFSRYFLTMKKVADFANRDRLCGLSRGSAGGSLLSYALNITQLDPIRFDLLFERFILKDQDGYPDIDFDTEEPNSLKESLAKSWGEDTVVPITNFNTLKEKSLLKDISKFYEIPFQEVNKVTKLMDQEAIPLAKADKGITAGIYEPTYEEYKKYSTTLASFLEKYPQIDAHVENLLGQIRSYSRHAGGVIIADNISSLMPLIVSKGTTQVPWSEGQNVRHLEPLGFIKFDLLGLETLSMIRYCVQYILKTTCIKKVKEFYEKNLHPDNINLDDQKVFENVFHNGNFMGIFQFTESGVQQFCLQVKPTTLQEICAITAIYRPGPLSSNVDKKFVKAKEGNWESEFPILRDLFKETYGNIIYQEQITKAACAIGQDITLEEGSALRKLLTKYKDFLQKENKRGNDEKRDKLEKIHKKFIKGAEEKSIKDYEKIWDSMVEMNKYAFNLSHSVAYSLTSYQCAWLATHYPLEWATAYLQVRTQNEKNKEKAIAEVKKLGYSVKFPNINTSTDTWEIDNNTIVAPLTFIKGLGDATLNEILAFRPFNTIEELLYNKEIRYNKINKAKLDAMVKAGTLDSLMDKRFDNRKHFWHCVVEKRTEIRNKKIEIFHDLIKETKGSFEDFSKLEQIMFNINLLGSIPIDLIVPQEIRNYFNKSGIKNISEIEHNGLCWFIPTKIINRKTKNGRPYLLLEIVDGLHEAGKVYYFSPSSEKLEEYTPYIAKVSKSAYGYNINGFQNIQKV